MIHAKTFIVSKRSTKGLNPVIGHMHAISGRPSGGRRVPIF